MEWELINNGNMLTIPQVIIVYVILIIIAIISVRN